MDHLKLGAELPDVANFTPGRLNSDDQLLRGGAEIINGQLRAGEEQIAAIASHYRHNQILGMYAAGITASVAEAPRPNTPPIQAVVIATPASVPTRATGPLGQEKRLGLYSRTAEIANRDLPEIVATTETITGLRASIREVTSPYAAAMHDLVPKPSGKDMTLFGKLKKSRPLPDQQMQRQFGNFPMNYDIKGSYQPGENRNDLLDVTTSIRQIGVERLSRNGADVRMGFDTNSGDVNSITLNLLGQDTIQNYTTIADGTGQALQDFYKATGMLPKVGYYAFYHSFHELAIHFNDQAITLSTFTKDIVGDTYKTTYAYDPANDTFNRTAGTGQATNLNQKRLVAIIEEILALLPVVEE